MPSFDAGKGIDGYPLAIGRHRGALDPQPRHTSAASRVG